MKKRVRTIFCALACVCLTAMGATPVFPVGTFVYVGVVRDYAGYILQKESGLRVQALNANGDVLAESAIMTPTDSGHNFRLTVPLATVASASAAKVGDTLRCAIVEGTNVVYAATALLPAITAANSSCEVKLQVATDSDGDGVSDEYVETLGVFLEAYGYSADSYDASADYDADGQSNYAEYIAGTDPFNESDYLHISSFDLLGESATRSTPQAAITFEYAGSRMYILQSASQLGEKADWQTEQNFMGSANHDVGVTTLYCQPVTNTRFFRVKVQSPTSVE